MILNSPDSSSVLEVNLKHISHNFDTMKTFAPKTCKGLAVIKANAYGHGAVEVAKYLTQADWFAVASISEAIELRKAGISKPILVLSTPREVTKKEYKTYDLTATISDLSHFDILEDATKAHLQFDTGMFRFGILPELLDEVISKEKSSKLHISGIFTHFANSSEPNNETVKTQLDLFNSLRSNFPKQWIAHAANTGAIAFYPETHLDMIRIGVSLYGYPAGKTLIKDLKPACSWKTDIIQVKPIKKGTGVGYNWTFTTPEDGYIHVIPIGYADGFIRKLGNKAVVKIGEEWIPVVGYITMDYALLFHKNEFKVGTEVEILGDGLHSAFEWAKQIDTIPYEILTRISERRVKRVYLK